MSAADINVLWLVGLGLWIAPVLATGLWMNRATREYVRLYQVVHEIQFPTLDREFYGQRLDDPRELIPETFGRSWSLLRILRERQPDPQLERARQKVLQRWLLNAAFLFLGAIVPIGFWGLGK